MTNSSGSLDKYIDIGGMLHYGHCLWSQILILNKDVSVSLSDQCKECLSSMKIEKLTYFYNQGTETGLGEVRKLLNSKTWNMRLDTWTYKKTKLHATKLEHQNKKGEVATVPSFSNCSGHIKKARAHAHTNLYIHRDSNSHAHIHGVPWCKVYRRRKLILRHVFKFRIRLFAFYIALIPYRYEYNEGQTVF